MTRILITYIVPLVAPFLLYVAWNTYARWRAKKTGEEPPRLDRGPIFWSIVAGFMLLVASLLTFAVIGGDDADSDYVPPRLEDGKIVPPTFERAPTQ